ncbi:hypothetical protein PPL_10959 [Heterostelium album PN500]|uniref:Uncharacterized protein n=1 Tax=Heterostelium pallidum (strain ATCC 26659 / Pp 5 / PN500) TaxID=670386 RepID=D3BSJ0_HETP5|nr:hypothetical protein PPL_10959 [Heterostelium album PN500]EFA75455.1 hypothetical protein PPL_10959 [Heterostelium album PN500]|eukprot:XP_020427589.1 hypothetical protein PPL_10959 [Heterostelium album PN500]
MDSVNNDKDESSGVSNSNNTIQRRHINTNIDNVKNEQQQQKQQQKQSVEKVIDNHSKDESKLNDQEISNYNFKYMAIRYMVIFIIFVILHYLIFIRGDTKQDSLKRKLLESCKSSGVDCSKIAMEL